MPTLESLTERAKGANDANRRSTSGGAPPVRLPTIAVVTDAILPFHRGGKEVLYAELTRRLASRANVHVYTMRWWQGRRRRVEGAVTHHGVCAPHDLYAGGRRSIRQGVAFALGCVRLTWRRFDVVYADQMPHLHLFVLWGVTRLRRRSLVVTCHEVWGRDYWCSYLGRLGPLAWLLERSAMRLPDVLIAGNEVTASRVRQELGPMSEVRCVPHGIDLALINRAQVAAEGSDVVVVGRLLSHKRIDLLVDALGHLRRRHGISLTCRVIGSGPELDALRRKATDEGVGDLVEFLTDVEDSDTLYGYVKAAKVFAFPSEREGFGIAPLEALACAVPVVTTSAPDNLSKTLVIEAGFGSVCAPTIDAFAAALADEVHGVERGACPPAHLAGWCATFDWDGLAQQVFRILLPVAATRGDLPA